MNQPRLIEFSTQDGLRLPGMLYEEKNNKKSAIYLHGNGTSSVFYHQEEKSELAIELLKKDISLLYFNNRGANMMKSFHIEKNNIDERKMYGTAYEIIKECVFDIDAAIEFLKTQGYTEFYLIGSSTGANKICVYNHYKPINEISKYILADAGDDTGIMYDQIGEARFWKLLKEAKEKIKKNKGEELIKDLFPDEIFSYQAFYDVANPDGDYNCFPYYEIINKVKLSTKKLFRYYKDINKPSLVVFGEFDEYAWGDVSRVVKILKQEKSEFEYQIISNTTHGMPGKQKDLGKLITEWINK